MNNALHIYIKARPGRIRKICCLLMINKAIRSFWLIGDYLPDGVTLRVTVARDILTNDHHYARTAGRVWCVHCIANIQSNTYII